MLESQFSVGHFADNTVINVTHAHRDESLTH